MRLSFPSWKSSISSLLVGVMKRRRVVAMSRCVCSGMCGQMASPESVVSVPISLSRVLACGHACVSVVVVVVVKVAVVVVEYIHLGLRAQERRRITTGHVDACISK